MELTPAKTTARSSLKSGEKITGWQLGRISPTPSNVPSGWELLHLTSVARLESGHTPSRRKPEYWEGDIPWISLHDSAALDVPEISATAQTIGPLGLANSSARLLPEGTVVFSRTATVGKATVMGRRMATSQDFANYVCGERLHNHFLVHLFRYMASEWTRLMAGSTHNSIYMPVFRDLQILLPPLSEQRAIARALGEMDVLIDGLRQLIAKKVDLKQAAMQQLLSGKRRLPGFQAKPGSRETEVGVIPVDWALESFGNIFRFSGGFSASRDQLSSEGHCYLHYGDIHNASQTFIDVRSQYLDIPKLDISLKRVSPKSLLSDGDIVFVDASEDDEGASRHVVVVNKENIPYISGLHTIVAKRKTTSLDDGYERYCFQSRDIKRQFYFYAVGTKVSGISKTNIAKIFMPIPPLPEQRAIATVLSDMDAELAALEQRRDKTRALKQGMMQELLTGKTRLV